jgi:GTP-binding protein
VVNKADDEASEARALGEFHRLGFGEPIAVSAEHGRGLEELSQRIRELLGPAPAAPAAAVAANGAEAAPRVKFALVGRPNVGKSSLGNALLKSPRLIVHETPGTTRDAVAIDFDYAAPNGETWPFTLCDTAGLRPAASIKASLEYFSQTRARQALADSDVVFLVLEALGGVTKQDQRLAGEILAAGRALVIVVNKWDIVRKKFADDGLPGYKSERAFQKAFIEGIEGELFFLPRSPVLFTSAIEGDAVLDILNQARALGAAMRRPLPTSPLNRVLRELIESRPPKFVLGRRFKCYYALQVARQPFVIRLYCNHSGKLDETYTRYLETSLINTFKLQGCPIRFDLIGKPKREKLSGTRKKSLTATAQTSALPRMEED